MREKIIIGTRSSKLALWQADYIMERLQQQYPELVIEKRLMTTKGDKILDAPLAKIGGKGLFTKELETAMLDGEIDIAVHSLKDMPVVVPEGLVITAITKREDPGDALVSLKYNSFKDLPKGAKIGTSSLRRKAQLLNVRPDFNVQDLRGNVNTRLQKLKDENFDAIILAVAGLKRLGFADKISEKIPQEVCLPAVGQGALAIETRSDDSELREMLNFLDDKETRACTLAERAFLSTVEGGCQVPVGVYAIVTEQGKVKVEAVIASLDGSRLYRDCMEGTISEGESLGHNLANKLLNMGGREILKEIGIEV